ncbi:hypothetical protein CNW10_1522 [Lactiplantibacillus plantarum]|nr:hypothetical protein LpDm1_1578 [Lactiplantibacillus plantarum]KZU16618.1 hypothetical protein CNW10_1522 [Lactiplantibacillus plantarum]
MNPNNNDSCVTVIPDNLHERSNAITNLAQDISSCNAHH